MRSCPKMQAVIRALTEKHGVDMTQPQSYLRLDMPNFDRLIVETIDARRLVVAHYFEQNGDLVPDPSVTFFVIDSGEWVPIGIEQALGGPVLAVLGPRDPQLTITEDGAVYGGEQAGTCGTEEPSMEQPCRLSNITTGGGAVEFDLECESLISAAVAGFDVGAIGPGPTTIRFENCTGF